MSHLGDGHQDIPMRHKMKRVINLTSKKLFIHTLIAIFLILYFIQEGIAMGEKIDYNTQIKEKFRRIDFSDGISKEEAIIIAQNYLLGNEWGKNCNLRSAKIFAENDSFWDKASWHIGFDLIQETRLKTGLKWTIVNVEKKTGKATPGGEGPS